MTLRRAGAEGSRVAQRRTPDCPDFLEHPFDRPARFSLLLGDLIDGFPHKTEFGDLLKIAIEEANQPRVLIVEHERCLRWGQVAGEEIQIVGNVGCLDSEDSVVVAVLRYMPLASPQLAHLVSDSSGDDGAGESQEIVEPVERDQAASHEFEPDDPCAAIDRVLFVVDRPEVGFAPDTKPRECEQFSADSAPELAEGFAVSNSQALEERR